MYTGMEVGALVDDLMEQRHQNLARAEPQNMSQIPKVFVLINFTLSILKLKFCTFVAFVGKCFGNE